MGTTLGMGDGEYNDLFAPDRVGNVVFAKARIQVCPPDAVAADIVEMGIL